MTINFFIFFLALWERMSCNHDKRGNVARLISFFIVILSLGIPDREV